AGADNPGADNVAAGSAGGGVTIETNDGAVTLAGGITTSGGSATANINNGGAAGAIAVTVLTAKQVTLSGNLTALGGARRGGAGTAGAKANATITTPGTIQIAAALQTRVLKLVLNGGTIDVDANLSTNGGPAELNATILVDLANATTIST